MTAAILGILLGFIGSMPVAGPIAVMVLRKGLRHEYDEGAAIALGASLPEAVYCGMALLGFDYLFVHYPQVEDISRLLGGIIMVMLGLSFVMMRPKAPDTVAELPHRRRKTAPFMTGFTVSALNPTLILTWSGVAAVLYAYMGPFSELDKLVFPAGVGLGNFLWFALMLSLMQRHHARFSQRAVLRAIRLIGSGILLFGLWMLVGAIQRYTA